MVVDPKANPKMNPKRGEIWWIRFSSDKFPAVGDEIQKMRPAVVISTNNANRLALRLVVPLTNWNPAFENYFWHVTVAPSSVNNLSKVSSADTFQTRSVSLERFDARLGVLEGELLKDVALALSMVIEEN